MGLDAVIQPFDHLLRDAAGVFAAKLEVDGITHDCGEALAVRWLSADGRILRWMADMDALEAVVIVRCTDSYCVRRSIGRDDGYHYGRMRVSGSSLARADHGHIIRAISHECRHFFPALYKHLERLYPAWDRAMIRALQGLEGEFFL